MKPNSSRISTKLAYLALLLAIAAGCTHRANPGPNVVSASPGPSGSADGLVRSRAPKPTQQDVPGIQFMTGSIDVSVNGHDFSIAADDWNTITDASVVAHNVGVSLDPDFHAAATTRNRFQYLADRIVPFAPPEFYPIGIVSAPQAPNFVVIAALINLTGNTYQLSGLHVTVTEEPPTATVATGTFYSAAGASLIVPGNNIYFVRLTLPVLATPPSGATKTTYSFHWDRLYNCGANPCP
jgi:hypothetical protein